MHPKQLCCLFCKHFHRDFNQESSYETLKEQKVGYCMYFPPKPYYVEWDHWDMRDMKPKFPLVDEDAVCSCFESR